MLALSRLLLAIALFVVTLAPASSFGASASALRAQLAVAVSDPAILDFLVDEAVRSRVTRINIVTSANLKRRCRSAVYGCSSWEPGKSRTEVYLASDVSGGTGIINITHELSHAAVFRQGCLAHGKRWIDYWLGVAARFEQKFPGRKWGNTSPTKAVEARRSRYAREMGRC